MRKMTAIAFVAILTISALVSLSSVSINVVADGPNQEHPEKQNVTLYMYGPGTNWSNPQDHYEYMNTTFPVNETPTKYRHNDTYAPLIPGARQGTISKWYTEPLEKDIEINETLYMQLYARGNILDISFTIIFYRINENGQENQIGNYRIDTNRQNLNDKNSLLFEGETTIPTDENIALSKGWRFGIEISYDGTSTDDLLSGHTQNNRNVTLCYASKVIKPTITERGPSNLKFQCDSIEVEVKKSTTNVNKKYVLISTDVYSAFGGPTSEGNLNSTDVYGYCINVTGPVEGKHFMNEYDKPLDITYDNTSKVTTVYYQWNYGQDNAVSGDYWLNISIQDNSGNWWVGSMVSNFVVGQEWKVDFRMEQGSGNILFKVDNKEENDLYVNEYVDVYVKTEGRGDENYFEGGAIIKVKLIGTEVNNPNNQLFSEDAFIEINLGISTDSFVWRPKQTGDFNIKITLDPDNDQPEEYKGEPTDDENNTGWYMKGSNKGKISVNKRGDPKAIINEPIYGITYQEDDFPLYFDGSSSTSGNDDNIEEYVWELDAKEIGNQASFSIEKEDFEFKSNHNYIVELTVKNTDGKEHSTKVSIIINTKPKARIEEPANEAVFAEDIKITFKSGSEDIEDEDNLEYIWEDNDEEFGDEKEFSKTLSKGQHDISLEIKDGYGGTDKTSIKIIVGEVNPPKAIITSPSNGDKFKEGEQITFDASSSKDSEGGKNLTYKWKSDIGGLFGEDKATFKYTQLIVGEHEITLTVEDNYGATATAYVNITVEEIPQLKAVPKANGKEKPDDVTLDKDGKVSVTFDAGDSEGDIQKYSWDFDVNDGIQEQATGKTVSGEFTEAGTYVVTLTISDSQGNTATDTVIVVVNEMENGGNGDDDDDDWKIYAGVGGAVAAVVIIGLAIGLSRRGKSKWEDEGWEEEEGWEDEEE